MKFIDFLTDEQKKELGNCYVLSLGKFFKLIDCGEELTRENFTVFYISNDEETPVFAKVQDFQFWAPERGDFDYSIRYKDVGLLRERATPEVIEFLDKELNKAQYENNE